MNNQAQAQVIQMPASEGINIRHAFALKALRRELKEKQTELAALEGEIMASLRLTGAVNFGVIGLTIKRTERRSPAWKKEFVARLGDEEAAAVTAATKPSVSERVELI